RRRPGVRVPLVDSGVGNGGVGAVGKHQRVPTGSLVGDAGEAHATADVTDTGVLPVGAVQPVDDVEVLGAEGAVGAGRVHRVRRGAARTPPEDDVHRVAAVMR